MPPGSLETARPSVTGATQGLCKTHHSHSRGEAAEKKGFPLALPDLAVNWRRILDPSLSECNPLNIPDNQHS
jgi:hypothetical protein